MSAILGNFYFTGLSMIGTAGVYGFGTGLFARKVFSLNIKDAAATFFAMELLALCIDKSLRGCLSFHRPYPSSNTWSFSLLQFLKEDLILVIAYLLITRIGGIHSGGNLFQDFVTFTAVHIALYTGAACFANND